MKRQTVADVMSRGVITVADTAPFKEIVRVLAEGGVSAVPVLDAQGRLVGIVTEADLLRKQEFQGDGHLSGAFATRRTRLAQAKARADLARDLMTTPVITTGPTRQAREAARLMARHAIKRLPVVDDGGQLVGIVSRADLLRVFLRSDEDIRAEIQRDIVGRTLLASPPELTVAVSEGVVAMRGHLEFRSDAELAVQLAHAVDGVVDVTDELTFQKDDSAHPRAHVGSLGGPAADWRRL